MRDFDGRSAVVTGAASGIGRALARRFASEGMRVVLADVERSALEETAGALEAGGAQVLAVPTDVSRPDEVERLAEASREAFGRIHVVCHNAGVFAAGLSWQTPLADYQWVFDVNVFGLIHGVRAFTPLQLEHGEDGHIVITASMAAVTAMPFSAPYTMSKHATLALAETLHLELEGRASAIGVSVLCPELVDTGIARSERNRPAGRARDDASHVERELVEKAIAEQTATGMAPDAIAQRTLDAMRARRFYVFPPAGDPWRRACEARLDAIREARNPGMDIPTG